MTYWLFKGKLYVYSGITLLLVPKRSILNETRKDRRHDLGIVA